MRDIVISSIDREHEEEQIDRTTTHYSCNASSWIASNLGEDYMLKTKQCLVLENDRVVQYLHASSKPKLVVIMQHELQSTYIQQLIEEKKFSASFSLLYFYQLATPRSM